MNEGIDISLSPKGIIFQAIGGFGKELETGSALSLTGDIVKALSRYMQAHGMSIEWVCRNGKDELVFVEQTQTH